MRDEPAFVGGELPPIPAAMKERVAKSLQDREEARLAEMASMVDSIGPMLEQMAAPEQRVSKRPYMPTDARGDQKKLNARRKANKIARKTRRKQRS